MTLSLKNIVSGYGKIPVIRETTLEMEQGAFVALAGANNSGKSTLLKTIAGVIRPASGRIVYNGHDLTGLAPHDIVRRGISFIPEGKPLFAEMTVYDNLLAGSYLPRARAERQKSLAEVMRLVPVLSARKNQIAGSLSGGEQQMLILGRALMSRPEVLLVDEPSLGLAPMVTERIYQVLKELNSQGMGILVADQNLTRLTEVSSQAFVLVRGNIFRSGQAAQILQDEQVKKACMGLV